MKFHELNVSKQTKPKRSGRGISAGRGKTAGRGTKGQGSRKSPGRVGFEGGQTPLTARIPKLPGFRSLRPEIENIYSGQLDTLKSQKIDNYRLAKAGLVSSPFVKVKLILKGELKNQKNVKLQAASSSAVKALEKAGGSFEKVEQLGRPRKPTDS